MECVCQKRFIKHQISTEKKCINTRYNSKTLCLRSNRIVRQLMETKWNAIVTCSWQIQIPFKPGKYLLCSLMIQKDIIAWGKETPRKPPNQCCDHVLPKLLTNLLILEREPILTLWCRHAREKHLFIYCRIDQKNKKQSLMEGICHNIHRFTQKNIAIKYQIVEDSSQYSAVNYMLIHFIYCNAFRNMSPFSSLHHTWN